MRVTCQICNDSTGKWGFSLVTYRVSKLPLQSIAVNKGDYVCVRCAWSFDIAIDQCMSALGDRKMTEREVQDLFDLLKLDLRKRADYRNRLMAYGLMYGDNRKFPVLPSVPDWNSIRSGKLAFRAKYKGLCKNCERIVQVGERIYFQNGVGIWHENCGTAQGQIAGNPAPEENETIQAVGRKFRIV